MVERSTPKWSSTSRICWRRTLVSLLLLCIVVLFACLFQLYSRVQHSWAGVTGIMGSASSSENYPRRKAGKIAFYTYTEDFHPINERGVYSFWNVCIEALEDEPIQRSRQLPNEKIYYNETKKVVVYDSFFRSGLQTLLTATSINALEPHWDIFFSRDPVPPSHKWLPDAAFFISQSCPGNFTTSGMMSF